MPRPVTLGLVSRTGMRRRLAAAAVTMRTSFASGFRGRPVPVMTAPGLGLGPRVAMCFLTTPVAVTTPATLARRGRRRLLGVAVVIEKSQHSFNRAVGRRIDNRP